MFEEEIAAFKKKAAITSSMFDLAILERDLWNSVRPRAVDVKHPKRDNWWKLYLEKSKSHMGMRAQILLCGEEASILWQKIDAKEITLWVAARLSAQCRQSGRSVADLLSEFENLPVVAVRKGNIPSRGHPRRSSKHPRAESPPTKDERVTWAVARAAVRDAIAPAFAVLDDAQRVKLSQELDVEVDMLFKRFQNLIYRSVRSPRTEMRRQSFINACRVLNVRPPRPGKTIDDKTKRVAQRHYRDLVRNYHPDLRGGDETLRSRFEAVVEAWNIFETFAKNEEEARNVATQ